MPSAHIYPLSRLVHAGPRAWQRMLEEIEEGSSYAFSYYLPMREAVVQFCSSRGHGRDQIVREMTTRARTSARLGRGDRLRDNTNAFETFEVVFYPKIRRFRRSLLHEKQDGYDFEGLTLLGAPHFEADDSAGRRRYAFLHAAKWSDDDLAAYLELLSIVVEEGYGADSRNLWIMDLRKGEDIRWRSSARMRRRCRDTAMLYAKLVNAIGTE